VVDGLVVRMVCSVLVYWAENSGQWQVCCVLVYWAENSGQWQVCCVVVYWAENSGQWQVLWMQLCAVSWELC
jgi:hypothetical protein